MFSECSEIPLTLQLLPDEEDLGFSVVSGPASLPGVPGIEVSGLLVSSSALPASCSCSGVGSVSPAVGLSMSNV